MGDIKKVVIDDQSCSVCKADFLKKDLDEQGRCHVCKKAGLLPGLKAEQEYVQKTQPKMDRAEIKELVREVLRELKEEENLAKPASFAPKVCTKCKQEFVPESPAQKTCNNCKETK